MRKFEASLSNGELWVHIDGWEYQDPQNEKELIAKLRKWIQSCQNETAAKLWICRACRPGCRGCGYIRDTCPDRCVCEEDLTDEELQEYQEEGHRAPVDWTQGQIDKLPHKILSDLRRAGFSPDVSHFELSYREATRALEVDEE